MVEIFKVLVLIFCGNIIIYEIDDRVVVWLDIDNTLYSASSKIADAMGERIHGAVIQLHPDTCTHVMSAYFTSLGLNDDEASELHLKYYKQYGLALRGLVRHHSVGRL